MVGLGGSVGGSSVGSLAFASPSFSYGSFIAQGGEDAFVPALHFIRVGHGGRTQIRRRLSRRRQWDGRFANGSKGALSTPLHFSSGGLWYIWYRRAVGGGGERGSLGWRGAVLGVGREGSDGCEGFLVAAFHFVGGYDWFGWVLRVRWVF